MTQCPICATETSSKRPETPYWTCPGCGLWFQDPMPSKTWHAVHELTVGSMSEDEKRINEQLARWLLREAMGGTPGRTYDIGASFPWLAYSLHRLGCEAIANDPSGELQRARDQFPASLRFAYDDFESVGLREPDGFRLITCVHSFEHLYDPIRAMNKMRRMLADDGALFIRCPDNQVNGYERDLTPGHYTIHPFFHSLSSIAELCAQTQAFVIERTYELRPGQRDMVLRPIA